MTPSYPSTSRAASGTRFCPSSARRAGPKPSPGGSSRVSTGPSAELSSGRPARTSTTAGEGRRGRHHHRHPSRSHLRPLAGAAGVDGRLGHHLRRPGGHPRLDGPELHHLRAPGPPARRVARDGPPPGAGPGGRSIVALVVRPGPGRGRRRFRLHRLLPERHPRRHAALDPEHADDGGAGRERGHGAAAGGALPGLRLLRPLRHRADDLAPGPHRHPCWPWPPSPWGCGFCPTRRAGAATGSGSL